MSGKYSVIVVGIGAMGGGMARALLDGPGSDEIIECVVGYDKYQPAVDKFFEEAKQFNKTRTDSPSYTLKEAVSSGHTDFVILSLVNEDQCETICFGGSDDDCLYEIMPNGSCVILTSTVTATWSKKANGKFQQKGILFCDCPVSGGPARARQGDLTMMASGDDVCLEKARPILDILGRKNDVHIIKGGAGAGSTVKCVHQLLAGVHIAVAGEALAMGAKAGLDVDQLCRIVNGAAGASWMFQDRTPRMLSSDPEVKSALDIFVKDLGIVLDESKKLQCPTPIASAALQQYICGQSLGLGQQDDSQVVKVYETITRTSVSKKKETETEEEKK